MVYFLSCHRAFQVTLAHREKMALRDPRLVKLYKCLSYYFLLSRNEVKVQPQWVIHRESKGYEVCQVQEEYQDFRWVWLWSLSLNEIYKKCVPSWPFVMIFFCQGDEGPVGPAGPAGLEVSADWMSPAAQLENTITQLSFSIHTQHRNACLRTSAPCVSA